MTKLQGLVAAFIPITLWSLAPACCANDSVDAKAQAVVAANRAFETPEMSAPSADESTFESTEVGAKIPNYTPGARWGTQEAPLTQMQNPLPAEKSIHAYEIPKGFQLSIWAKESDDNWPSGSQQSVEYSGLKGKPIAMNWDENGRLWVCETVDYPNELQTAMARGRDRIKICEDTDNDGHADKFTVFAENLSIPSTLVCYRGGVIVQDGQTTVYLKDIDGDGRADFRQNLITGWAMGDTHGGVSNFQYGPDNWIWGMQGYNNSEPVINGETQMRFRQGFWRFKVNRGAADETAPAYAIGDDGKIASDASDAFNDHTIRVEALEFLRATNNNTWGLGFSEEGYVFGSTANGCPSVHMPIPNRYFDQVTGWSPTTLERISDTHQFKPIDKRIRQVDWHGGYTAGCGSAIYTARNYPESWWNRIQMVCGPTGNLVGGFVLEKNGAGYRSTNRFNTVASVDDWSAPIMSEVGPDGNVWFIDWYNYIIQHNPTPNGFQTGKGAAYESDLRDKRFARVYRLLYNDAKASAGSRSLQLENASNVELVKALGDKNFFWRRTAQRLLVEREAVDAATLSSLVSLVPDATVDQIGLAPAGMHAIWTLSGLSDSGNADAKAALSKACAAGFEHVSSPVRGAAVSACSGDLLKQAIELQLHKDVDPRVRLAVLLRAADNDVAQSVPGDELASLITDVGEDEILLNAWTAAASTNPVETVVAVTNGEQEPSADEQVGERVSVLAEHIARNRPSAKQIERLLDADPDSPLSVALWNGLARGWPRDLVVRVSEDAQQKVRTRFLGEQTSIEGKAAILAVADKWSITDLDEIVGRIQDELLTVALSTDAATDERLDTWDQAIRLSPSSPKLLEAIAQLFTPQLSPEAGIAAINSLQSARVEGLSEQLLSLRSSLGPKLGSQILTFLLSRTDSTQHLLDAMEAGKLRFSDLRLDQRQAILNHPTRSIASRAAALMESSGATVTSDRQALVDAWMPITKEKGDATNGLAMFKKHCAACHIHGELGNAVGPNLTGMAVHPKAEMLVNVLDPSRSVETNFQIYQVITVDGDVVAGMLAGESANSIRLIDSQGKEKQILREDIDQLQSSPKSVMPEGFESLMTKAEMGDLLAFLSRRGKYTPLELSKVATVNGTKGLPGFRNRPGDQFELDSYGPVEIDHVPFELVNPQGDRVANIIGLQRPFRGRQATLPDSVSIDCSGNVSSLHILGGVAWGAFPRVRNESTSMVVRCSYADGTSKDHELINGKHIVTYQEGNDVPESKVAIKADGKQIRYLKVPCDESKELTQIELVKGDDFSIPLIFALTVESPAGN